MRHRWLSIVIIIVSGLGIYGFMNYLPQEIAPLEDRSRVQMFSQAPEGASYEYMDNYMDRMVQMIQDSIPFHAKSKRICTP